MIEYKTGSLVRSEAGHDKGNLFIIFKECGEYVYLVDGSIRKLEHPKCKKKKHVQVIHKEEETLSKKLINGEHVNDEEIKRFIKSCKREDQVVRR